VNVFGPYRGVVDLVHDADTVNVKLDVGFDLTVYARVRVAGVDAPELSTPEGKAARDFVRGLLPVGAQVLVTSLGWDKFGGRIDGKIAFGLKDLAEELLATGHAKPYDGKGVRPA
jgi:micrococcal nuclease